MPQEFHQIYWDDVAYHWHHRGSPLRPNKEDIRFMEKAVAKWSTHCSGHYLKALLFGVTPEIADMTWPAGTHLLAVEQSEEMIRVVWPGDVDGRRRAELGNWLNLPVIDGSYDVVTGDGCFNCMDYPEGYRALAASAHRVLKGQGILIMRFFVQPKESETLQDVFRDLNACRIGNFHVFKWRLAMALQENTRCGVKMNDIWSAWKGASIDEESLMSMTGWRECVIKTIAQYDGKDTRLSFPTLEELPTTFSDYFEEIAMYIPRYELGERCPTLTFMKRQTGNT